MNCPKCKKQIPEDAKLCCYCGKTLTTKARPHRRKGTGSVYKLSDKPRSKPWAAAKDGVLLGLYESEYAASKALEPYQAHRVSARINMTTTEVYKAWKADRGSAPKYETSWPHLAPIANMKFRDVKKAEYKAVISAMEDKGLSRATCDKVKQLCNFLSKWALSEDVIDKSYADFIELPKTTKTAKAIFTSEDIKVLKKYAHLYADARIVLILIYTGYREDELFRLKRKDVHLDQRFTIGGLKTDAGRERIVPISSHVEEHFRYFWEHPKEGHDAEEDYFLQNTAGGKLNPGNWRSRNFYPLLHSLKLDTPKKTPHCTRHTFATLAVRAKMAPQALQKIIGHVHYSTTADIYNHPDVEQLVAAMEAADEKWSNST